MTKVVNALVTNSRRQQMKGRVVAWVLWSVLSVGAFWMWNKGVDVPLANAAALAQVNGGNAEFAA